MKKLTKILAICALVLISFTANAQLKLGVGGGIALPMGDFGDAVKTGFGVNVGGKYMLNDNMALGLDLGYHMFSAKEEVDGYDLKFSVIPIAPSFTYYFATEGFKPYAGVNVGFYMGKTKVEYEGVSMSTTETKLGFAPILGFEYALGEKMGLDVNAKYNYITSDPSTTYLGINVGLVFGL